jgi:hypothetical protein
MENSQSFRAQSELSIPILSPILYIYTPILSDKKKNIKNSSSALFYPIDSSKRSMPACHMVLWLSAMDWHRALQASHSPNQILQSGIKQISL